MGLLGGKACFEVLEAANEAVVGVNAAGEIEFVNLQARSCFGYRRDELLGEKMDILIPNCRPGTGTSAPVELRARTRDRSEFPVRVTFKPIELDGSPIVFVFVEDMRERKEARRSSHLLEIFFQYTLTQIAFLDRDFNFIRVNDAYAKAGRRDVSEFPGRNHFELYPSDAQPIFEEVVRTREPYQAFARPFEYADDPERGVTYWDWTLAPILDEKGEVEMLVFSLNDVTERERATQALRRNEQLLRHTQKMEAMGRLAGGISHDFNNMLTAIGGHAALLEDILRKVPDLPEDANESLWAISRSTEQAGKLTRQLLAFTRRDDVHAETLIDLDRLVAEMKDMIRPLIRESVELRIFPATGLPPIRIDPSRIEQVVMNLIINASDAMPQGGTLTLATGAEEVKESDVAEIAGAYAGPHVTLSVSDTGLGMDTETLRRIYEPFFTTKPVGEGTGLGLAVVRDAVSQAGGHVRVSSAPGRGTSFRVYFPAYQGARAEKDAESGAEEVRGGEETILVCEDDELVRALACQVLERKGYKVLSAGHAHEALDLARSYRGSIHLLATDIVMPYMSGPKLADVLSPMRPEMKVLFLSGYTAGELTKHGRQNDPFLAKPYTSAQLLRAVRSALGGEEEVAAP